MAGQDAGAVLLKPVAQIGQQRVAHHAHRIRGVLAEVGLEQPQEPEGAAVEPVLVQVRGAQRGDEVQAAACPGERDRDHALAVRVGEGAEVVHHAAVRGAAVAGVRITASRTTEAARTTGTITNGSASAASSPRPRARNSWAHGACAAVACTAAATLRACCSDTVTTARDCSGRSRMCSNTRSTVRATSAFVDSTTSPPVIGMPVPSGRYSAVTARSRPVASPAVGSASRAPS